MLSIVIGRKVERRIQNLRSSAIFPKAQDHRELQEWLKPNCLVLGYLQDLLHLAVFGFLKSGHGR